MQQKSSSIMAYMLAALMLATAIIYFVAAVEEWRESEDRSEQTAAKDNDFGNDEVASSSALEVEEQGGNGEGLGAQVQTAFFAIVGLGYASIGGWVLKDKGRTNAPCTIAIVGSISIIVLYVASRTVNLPIVGLQEDVGTIDIFSKVLQVAIIMLAAYTINSRKVFAAPTNRLQRG